MALVVALALLMSACAGLGLATPQTFDERLAFAYATHTGVQNAAANALSVAAIDFQDGGRILELADQSRAVLDSAKLIHDIGDTAEAHDRLTLAIAILQQAQIYLDKRMQDPPRIPHR